MAKELVAMLLAGGQGSRLYALTQKLAKPAVPFGGKYRIIDFPLSNCVNSGIDTVGILTQYQPFVLNEYIGNGQPWDLDRLYGGVHVLPPYQKASGSDWYKGTANAIYQNIAFIERYDPQYVIILSGDQICKQDYSDFLEFHKKKGVGSHRVRVLSHPEEELAGGHVVAVDGEHNGGPAVAHDLFHRVIAAAAAEQADGHHQGQGSTQDSAHAFLHESFSF